MKNINISMINKYQLTDNGKQVLNKGFPEIQVLEAIKEKPNIKINEIDKKLSVGIGQAKKEMLISFNGAYIEITSKGEEVLKKGLPEEVILKKINDGKRLENSDSDILQNLIKRNLIKKSIIKKSQKERESLDEISELTRELLENDTWKEKPFKKFDIHASAPDIYPSKKQPYRQFLDDIKKKLLSLGFVEMKGPLVELAFWNFDALFQAQDHPAREVHDSFNIEHPKKGILPEKHVENVKMVHENGGDTGSKGWGYKWDSEMGCELVARSQLTALSARALSKINIPAKRFAIGRVFRPEKLDRTHLMEFNQLEGIIADESITFKSLLGILQMFAKEVAGIKKTQFFPAYYPFTEPSVDLMAYKDDKWVELGGAGIFRPEVTKPFGVDVPVIAWGLGIDRLAMFKLNINDIRYLFADDLNWIRKPYLFRLKMEHKNYLKIGLINGELVKAFDENKFSLSSKANITKEDEKHWIIKDSDKTYKIEDAGKSLNIYL